VTRDLEPDRRDLVQRLFADITSALEVAHAFASTGQSHALSPAEYARCAERLKAAISDVETLGAAIRVVLSPTEEVSDGAPDSRQR
jgi:dihydrodipicolinate synthase/N-acetylneuraminate lyase